MFDCAAHLRHMQRMHIGFFDAHPWAPGYPPHLRRRRHQRHVHAGVFAIVDDFSTCSSWRSDAHHQLVAGAAGLCVLPLISSSLASSAITSARAIAASRRHRTHHSFTQEHVSGMSVCSSSTAKTRLQRLRGVNRLHMIAFKDTIFAYALYYPPSKSSPRSHCLVIWRGGFSVLSQLPARHHRVLACSSNTRSASAAHPGFERQIQHSAGRHGAASASSGSSTPAGDRHPGTSAARRRSNRIEFRTSGLHIRS